MKEYTILFQDFSGRVFSMASLEAPNDKQAISIARRVHSSGIGQGYEIRCEGHHVHSERLAAPHFGLTSTIHAI